MEEVCNLIVIESGRGGLIEVGFPCLEGEGLGVVSRGEGFGGASDEEEVDVGVLGGYCCELVEEVASYAAGA